MCPDMDNYTPSRLEGKLSDPRGLCLMRVTACVLIWTITLPHVEMVICLPPGTPFYYGDCMCSDMDNYTPSRLDGKLSDPRELCLMRGLYVY